MIYSFKFINRKSIFVLYLFLTLIFSFSVNAGIRKVKNKKDLMIPVWIYFTDKLTNKDTPKVSERALARRLRVGFNDVEKKDAPVSDLYLREIEKVGGVLKNVFKWENAASFYLPPDKLTYVKSKPFVKSISPVGRYVKKKTINILKKQNYYMDNYGYLSIPLSMLNIPQAHLYLNYLFNDSPPGEGVRVAFFDSGFRLDHPCFKHLHERGAIKGTYDFIDHDTSVEDPDSVRNDLFHPLWMNDVHGSEVLAIFAGYDPPYYTGVAWGADILLARTEDAFFDGEMGEEHELHIEEDNWAAAVVWAESLGVDIISTSLGYSYGFQDTIVIEREDGKLDTIVEYSKSDMDGKTTIISKAAKGAIERGVLIVAAAGNEQEYGDTSICAPADVDGVIAVGAVNNKGILTSFSSLGPSADGRIKPDLVAPGININIPLIMEPDQPIYSITNSGTSFATPFISGICALVKQIFPDFKAKEIREKIYKSCKLLPLQDKIDNRYGYGIPDALVACMRSNKEVLLVVTDTGGMPFKNCAIINNKGDTISTTKENGTALFIYENDTVSICYNNKKRDLILEPPPSWKEVYPCSLVVKISDTNGKALPDVKVKYIIGNIESIKKSDSNGIVIIESFFPDKIDCYILKDGYKSYQFSETLTEITKKIDVRLNFFKRAEFEVYPTVLRKKRENSTLIMRVNLTENKKNIKVRTEIRTLNGSLIWYNISFVNSSEPLINQWNASLSKVSPGTYFVLISCENKKFHQRIIISE